MQKVFLFFLFPSILLCQSEFTENNDFGLSAGYTLSRNDVMNSSAFDFVLTFLGVLDVGVQTGSGDTDYKYSSSQISTDANLLYASYCFKRRNNNLVLKISAGYYTAKFDMPYSSNISSSGAIFGLGVYPRFVNTDGFSIRAAIELSYGILSTTSDSYLSRNSDFDNSRSISLGINLAADPTKNFHIIFSPFAAWDLLQTENSSYYGLNSRIFISFEPGETNTDGSVER